MAEKTDWILSTKVSLNLSFSFFKADSLISSLVDYYFCFFIYSRSYYSTFYLALMTPLSLVCSYLAFARSFCKIYTIFWFLDFSFVYLLKSFLIWDISPYSVEIFFSRFSLTYCNSLISFSLALMVFPLFWIFSSKIFCYFLAFSNCSLALIASNSIFCIF